VCILSSIEEIGVFGQGHILFRHKFNIRAKNINRKAIVRDTKLHVPIPYDFQGTIKADQYLVTLKIIPNKPSFVKLYNVINSNGRPLKTFRTYTSKVNKIQK